MNSQVNRPDTWELGDLPREVAHAIRLASRNAADMDDRGSRVWVSRDSTEVVVLVEASRDPSRSHNGGEYDYYTCFMPTQDGVIVYGDWSADWDMADWGGRSVFCASEIKSVDELYAKIDGMYKAAVKAHSTLEAAAALGLTKRAVQRAIRVGTLAATRQGRDWFVSQAAIEDYRRDHLRRYGRKARRQ